MFVTAVILAVIIILAFTFFNGKYNEKYWQKRGVTFHKKNKVMGPVWDFITQDRSMFMIFEDLYKQYPKDSVVAFGSLFTPALLIKDPTNIHHVTQVDFNSFTDRGLGFCENDKLALNVLFLNGQRWRLIRNKLTSLFTSTKLKNMFHIIDKSAQDFVHFLKSNPERRTADAFYTLDTYCCAATAAAVFGIGTESTFESRFLDIVKESLLPTPWKNLQFAVSCLSTSLFKAMNMTLFSVQEEYFIKAIKQVLMIREKENVKRYDFADICISMKKNGTMRDPETGLELEPTDELLAAQAFFFFLAGVEPCAAAVFSALFELGRNPDMLQRVHEEVDNVFEKYNNQLTYEAVSEMEYLEKVINEGLRMYPPIGYVTRDCVQDTVLPIGNVKVDKGTKIYLPIYAFHHDPKYFREPEIFDPERFPGANSAYFMPFGLGYRNCFGMRYAQLQVKTGLAHVLHNFTVKSIVNDGGIQFKKEQLQIRLKNVNFEFIVRSAVVKH